MCKAYKVRGWTLVLGAVLLLAGCGDDPLSAYREAVAEVTGGEVTAEPPPLLPYPARRERALPLEEVRIGFIGYLRLTGCRLMGLVSERNSALGKVMPPSRRLAYELDFLAAARDCRRRVLADDEPDREFIAELDEIVAQKRQQLPRVLWLATFDSSEFQQALSLAASPLRLEEEAGFADSLEAVAYLTGLGVTVDKPALDGPVDISALEARYQALQAHEYGGRLFQTLADLSRSLDAVTRALEALAARPLCSRGQPTEEVRVLERVYREHYLQTVEPHLERVTGQGRRWLTALDELLAVIEVEPPPAFVAYRQRMLSLDDDGGLWQAFLKIRSRHDRAWAVLFEQCGVS